MGLTEGEEMQLSIENVSKRYASDIWACGISLWIWNRACWACWGRTARANRP